MVICLQNSSVGLHTIVTGKVPTGFLQSVTVTNVHLIIITAIILSYRHVNLILPCTVWYVLDFVFDLVTLADDCAVI